MKKIAVYLTVASVMFSMCTQVFAEGGLDNFRKNVTYTNQFEDVSEKDWFYDNVKSIYEYGIMSGDSERTFNPEGNLSIAESLVIYCKLHKMYNNTDYEFENTSPWYQTYIDYAAEMGITYNGEDGFDTAIKRSDFAVLLSMAFPDEALPGINDIKEGSIPDVSQYSYYKESVYKLYRAGILTGNDKYGTFDVDSSITRGAVAAIVSRMVEPSLRVGVCLYEAPFNPVQPNDLANLSSLKRKLSDDKFMQAYNMAVELVRPFAHYSLEDQLTAIAVELRKIFESGMEYSMTSDNYNNVYGFFVDGSASCAGCTRATGLCLNILGIPYEHINENQYEHQWCRVNTGDDYWIADAYGYYVGAEPAPYKHPWF